ncbi:MAG: FAD binding domain-containing protein [Planctomycetota bacterium]|jgi:xanthine dehydrogenase YagS FAD-binding subunit
MNNFEYASPDRIRDAVGLLSKTPGQTEVLAGGTDLITALKQDVTSPRRVVSLKNVPGLDKIQKKGDTLRIGAMVTLGDLIDNDDVGNRFPSLVQAAEGVGSAQILAKGTVGGDLCQRPRCWYFRQGFGLLGQHNGKSLIAEGDNRYHAIFGNSGPAKFVNPSSLAPGLIALGANVAIVGPNGDRRVAAKDFFQTPADESQRENVLQPNEIVAAVEVPISGVANATYEVRPRQGLDWPLVTASVTLGSNARVVLGHVAPTPWLSAEASGVLKGKKVTAELAAKAGRAATEGATPLSRNSYKVLLVSAAVKRAAMSAAGMEV